jgi:mono/diheme cytochrome c family protein
MVNSISKPLTSAAPPGTAGHIADYSQSILVATVQESHKLRPSDVNRRSIFRRIIFGVAMPALVISGLFGCQSAQEKASASDVTVAAATKVEPPQATPAVVAPTTAAEPAAKPAVPVPVITEGIVTAAKAAFESNKCGTCHFVGAFPSVKPATAKNDLGSIGITRSSVWISNFLQKKEKVDGKFHMKTFAGTPAERDVLAQWLAAQKAAPLPAKPSGAK